MTAGDESLLSRLDPAVPLPLALVVARREGRTLLVLNRWRQEWELPGGMIDPGETPRTAAGRELVEETGQLLPALTFAAVALFELAPDRRREHAAVYTAAAAASMAFEPDDEIEALCWWDGGPLPRLAELDAEIARRVAQPPSRHEAAP